MEKRTTKKLLQGIFPISFLLYITVNILNRVILSYWDKMIDLGNRQQPVEHLEVITEALYKWGQPVGWVAIRFLPTVIVLFAVLGKYSLREMMRILGMGLFMCVLAFLVMLPCLFFRWPFFFEGVLFSIRQSLLWLIGAGFVASFICWFKALGEKEGETREEELRVN